MDGVLAGRLSRRELLAGALLAAGAGSLAATDAATGATPPPSDGDLLTAVFNIEQLTVFCYEHVLASGRLENDAQAVAQGLLGQEQAHTAALAAQLVVLGRSLPPAPASIAAADSVLSAKDVSGSLATLRTQDDALKLLEQVVSLAQGAYYTAILGLRSTDALQRAVQALANEAQQGTMLSLLRYPGDVPMAVPYAFVQGTT